MNPKNSQVIYLWSLRNVCLQTYINNRTCQKVAYFLRKIQTSRANNSRILMIKNAKFSGYNFIRNTNISWDFQICISVPLMELPQLFTIFAKLMSKSLTQRKKIWTVMQSFNDSVFRKYVSINMHKDMIAKTLICY